MQNRHFSTYASPRCLKLPITIILDSEHDYALKNALATALGGPTGKTFELGQKICKIDIFRLLHALDACSRPITIILD